MEGERVRVREEKREEKREGRREGGRERGRDGRSVNSVSSSRHSPQSYIIIIQHRPSI